MIRRLAWGLALLTVPVICSAEYWVATLKTTSGKVWYVPRYTSKAIPVDKKQHGKLHLKIGDGFRIAGSGKVVVRYEGSSFDRVLVFRNGKAWIEPNKNAEAAAAERQLKDVADQRMTRRGGLPLLSPAEGDLIPLSELAFYRMKSQTRKVVIVVGRPEEPNNLWTVELPQGAGKVVLPSLVANVRGLQGEKVKTRLSVGLEEQEPGLWRPFFVMAKDDEVRLRRELVDCDAANKDPFEREVERSIVYSRFGCVFLAERCLLRAYTIRRYPPVAQKLNELAGALGDTETEELLRGKMQQRASEDKKGR